MEDYRKDVLGNNEGVGYSEEGIVDATGVSSLHDASSGYMEGDGTVDNTQQQIPVVEQKSPEDEERDRVKKLDEQFMSVMLDSQDSINQNANYLSSLNGVGARQMINYNAAAHADNFWGNSDDLDQFMRFEYGKAKFDTRGDILTTNAAKYNRQEQQNGFVRAIGNGVPRMAVRAVGTFAATFTGIASAVVNLVDADAGRDFRNSVGPTGVNKLVDDFTDWYNDVLPVYVSEETEQAAPWSLKNLGSANFWANTLDTVGFTLGGAAATYVTGGWAVPLTVGAAGLELATDLQRSNDPNDRSLSTKIVPSIAAIGGALISKYVPKAVQAQMQRFAVGLLSASGEAESEVLSHRKDFMMNKYDAFMANTQHLEELENDRFNNDFGALNKEYSEKLKEIYDGKYDDATKAIKKALLDAEYNPQFDKLRTEHESKVKDIKNYAVKAYNNAYREYENAAGIIRNANIAILTLSNAIGATRMFNGGYRRFLAYGKPNYAKGVTKEAAEKVMRGESVDGVGTKVFDEEFKKIGFFSGKGQLLGIKSGASEYAEEFGQNMWGNAGKAYAEVYADDYYGQITDQKQFRAATDGMAATMKDIAWQAGFKAMGDSLTDGQAHLEGMMGFLMGYIGIPMLQKPKVTAETINGQGKKEKKTRWRSPIRFLGGIMGEIEEENRKNQMLAEKAKELNELLTPEKREEWKARMLYMAKSNAYAEEKEKATTSNPFVRFAQKMRGDNGAKNAAWVETGDKNAWINADDKELLSLVELMLTTGQEEMLDSMISMIDPDASEADLRKIKNMSSVKDANGNEVGEYSNYKIEELTADATEEQKREHEQNVRDMRKKIKENRDHLKNVVEAYKNNLQQIIIASNNGFDREALKMLTWYKTRVDLFEQRASEIYERNAEHFNAFNDAIGAYVAEVVRSGQESLDAVNSALADGNIQEKDKKELSNKKQSIENTIQVFQQGLLEWQSRWREVNEQPNLSVVQKTNKLFMGNVRAMINLSKISDSAIENQRAMEGLLMSMYTQMNDANTPFDSINSFLTKPEERAKFASEVYGIAQCLNNRQVYQDKFNYYKKFPNASREVYQLIMDDLKRKAAKEEQLKTENDLKSSKFVGSIYNVVERLIKEGKSVEEIEDTIYKLISEGQNSEVLKAFINNMKFLQDFHDALSTLIYDGSGRSGKIVSFQRILLRVMFDAAKTTVGEKNIIKKGKEILTELLADQEKFIKYITENNLVGSSDVIEDIREVLKKDPDNSDKLYGKLKKIKIYENEKDKPATKFEAIQKEIPKAFDVALEVMEHQRKAKQENSEGPSMSEEEIEAYNKRVEETRLRASRASLLNYRSSQEYDKLENVIAGFDQSKAEQAATQTANNPESKGKKPEGDNANGTGSTPTESPNKRNKNKRNKKSNLNYDDGSILDDEDEALKDEQQYSETLGYSVEVDKQLKSKQTEGKWIPSVPFFNSIMKEAKKLIRICNTRRVKKGDKTVEEVCAKSESPWSKFWDMLQKLNVFSNLDEKAAADADAIHVGDDVYFIIDKFDEGAGKSEIFGLSKEELTYDGRPIIFMAVKKSTGYKCIGTMETTESVLQKNNKLDFYNQCVQNAAEQQHAYIHNSVAKVSAISSGLVETSDTQNKLSEVTPDYKDRLITLKDVNNGTIESEALGGKATIRLKGGLGLKPSTLYLLVKDNVKGDWVPMRCAVGRFNKKDEQRLSETKTWKRALEAIRNYCNVIHGDNWSKDEESTAFSALNGIINLTGYGIHININKNKDTNQIYISVEKRTYIKDDNSQQEAKETTEAESKGENNEEVSEEQKAKYTIDYGVDVRFNGDLNQLYEELKEVLMTNENFKIPFRINNGDIDAFKTGETVKGEKEYFYAKTLQELIDEGIVSINLAKGGGDHTVGSYAVVDATNLKSTTKTDESDKSKEEDKSKGKPVEDKNKNKKEEPTSNGYNREQFVNGVSIKESKSANGYKTIVVSRRMYDTENNLKTSEVSVVYTDDGIVSEVLIDGVVVKGKAIAKVISQNIDKVDILSIGTTRWANSNGVTENMILIVPTGKTTVKVYNVSKETVDGKKSLKFELAVSDRTKKGYSLKELAHDYVDEVGRMVYAWRFLDKQFGLAFVYLNPQNIFNIHNVNNYLNTLVGSNGVLKQKVLSGEVSAKELNNILDTMYHEGIEIPDATNGIPEGWEGYFETRAFLSKLISNEQAREAAAQAEAAKPTPPSATAPSVVEEESKTQAADTQQQAQGTATEQSATTDQQASEPTTDVAAEQQSSEVEAQEKSATSENVDASTNDTNTSRKARRRASRRSDIKSQDKKAPRINVEYEVAKIREMLPWIAREDAFRIVNGLIIVGNKGAMAQGLFENGIITLSRNAKRGTGFHEAFHYVFNTMMDEQLRQDMIDEVKAKTKIENDEEAEEWLAETFANYMVNRTYPKSLWQKIKEWFESLLKILSIPHNELTPLMEHVFRVINEEARHETLKSDVQLTHLSAKVRLSNGEYIKDNSFSNLNQETKDKLFEAGITPMEFELLSPDSRKDALGCL
jgi:hypothetical protein